MRAMVFNRFGEPEELHLAEMPVPIPGPGEVLVAVRAVSVNPADWKLRRGWLECYFPCHFPFIPGFDMAGTVTALGSGVSGLTVGQRVVAVSNVGMGMPGSYAEFAIAAAERVVPIADHVSFERAAALPTAAMTALEALVEVGQLQPGQRVLVNGGAGGTGSHAVAIAARSGARVAATCSPRNLNYVRSLGSELALDYTTGDIAAQVQRWAPEGIDLVVDAVGQGSLLEAVEWVCPGGTIAAIGTLIADELTFDLNRAAARGVKVVPTVSSYARQGEQLRQLAAYAAQGWFNAIPLTLMPLAEAAEAHRLVEQGHVRGKVCLMADQVI